MLRGNVELLHQRGARTDQESTVVLGQLLHDPCVRARRTQAQRLVKRLVNAARGQNTPGTTTESSVPENRYTLSSARYLGLSMVPVAAVASVMSTSALTEMRSGLTMHACRAVSTSPCAQ